MCWDGIAKSILWHCLMKGSIKHCYLPGICKYLFCYFYTRIAGRVMQGCQRKKPFYISFYFISNKGGSCIFLAAMHDAMPYNINSLRFFDYAICCMGK